MTRVYAIHSGEYSDQDWGPVFSTVERALAYRAAHPEGNINDILVYVLDDEKDTGPVYPIWRLIMDRDGNVLFSEHAEPELYEPLLHGRPEVRRIPKGARWYMLDSLDPAACVGGVEVSGVYAPDLDHAVKIAGDARAEFLAMEPKKGAT